MELKGWMTAEEIARIEQGLIRHLFNKRVCNTGTSGRIRKIGEMEYEKLDKFLTYCQNIILLQEWKFNISIKG
jgi:hypothetical protein